MTDTISAEVAQDQVDACAPYQSPVVRSGYVGQLDLSSYTLAGDEMTKRERELMVAMGFETLVGPEGKRFRVAFSPKKGSRIRQMRGALRSFFGEALELYLCAPSDGGKGNIEWVIDQMADLLAAHEVIVVEYLDSKTREQCYRTDLISQEAFVHAANLLRGALGYAQREVRRVDEQADRVSRRASAFKEAATAV